MHTALARCPSEYGSNLNKRVTCLPQCETSKSPESPHVYMQRIVKTEMTIEVHKPLTPEEVGRHKYHRGTDKCGPVSPTPDSDC